MKILNDELSFETLPPHIKGSFNGLMAKRQPIEIGTYLYKFTDWELFNTKTDSTGNVVKTVSPFWGAMSDLDDILAYAISSRKTLLDCVRERNAVLHNWNGLTSLIVIQITQKVIGFTGNIGPQTERGYAKAGQSYSRHFTAPIAFWGGASQVYLPNLDKRYITEKVPPNTVMIRDDATAVQEFLSDYVK